MNELQRFAEHVRITCSKVLAADQAGNHTEAMELVSALSRLAGDVQEQGEMERDASDPGRYDLTTLPPPDHTDETE